MTVGTWGSGLYDNDSALDQLADLVRVDLDRSPAHLAAGLGLALWMDSSAVSVHPERYRAAIEGHPDWVAAFPDDVRAVIERVVADPEGAVEGRSRLPEVRQVIGGYSDGPRYDALFAVPGAREVLAELHERCASLLDRLDRSDLYEAARDLSPMGVLLELRALGFRVEAERVGRWRERFDTADRATTSERGFWDEYVGRVRPGFDLLLAGG